MPAYGPMAAYSSSTHNGFSSPAPSAKCRIVSSVASELNCLIRRGTPIRVLTRSISSSVMTSIELKTSLLKCPRFVEYQQTRRAARAHLLGGADPSKVRTNSPQSVNASCESLPSARLRRQGRRTPVSAESHPMAGRHPVLCSRCPLPYEDLLDHSSRGTGQDAKLRRLSALNRTGPDCTWRMMSSSLAWAPA